MSTIEEVLWLDAAHDPDPAPIGVPMEDGALVIRTVGYVVYEDRQDLVLAQQVWDTPGGQCCHRVRIPKGCVIERRVLSEPAPNSEADGSLMYRGWA